MYLYSTPYERVEQKLFGIEFLIAQRNKSVLDNIVWNEQDIINKAITKFGQSIALDAVYANIDSDVAELKEEKAILNIRLNLTAVQPPATTGKP